MATDNPKHLEQAAELAALAALPDDQINTRDIPEQRDWSGAKRGVFSPLVRDRRKALNELARLGQEIGVGYEK